MRAVLALLAVLALAAQPALAQSKTKSSPVVAAVEALDMCEAFALGGEAIVDDAAAAGWDAGEQGSESPFIRHYVAAREFAGLGWGDLFALVETYPGKQFGYCRIDFVEASGSGRAAVEAIAGLHRYDGEVREDNGGYYASLAGENSLLLTHWDEAGFVIQLTVLTPTLDEPAASPEPESEADE